MSQDLNNMCKGLHGWQEYERGVEALQKIVASENNRDAGRRKALSFSDLLIKVCSRIVWVAAILTEVLAYPTSL